MYEYSRAKLIEEKWANQSDIVFITDNPNSTLKNHIYIGPYEKGGHLSSYEFIQNVLLLHRKL
jgi:hypothetical protein